MPEPIGAKSAIPELAPSEPPEPGRVAPNAKADAPSPAAQLSGTRALVERFAPGSSFGLTSKPASWYAEKAAAELDCLSLPPAQALRVAEWGYMPRGGLAQQMMDHFLSGSSAPVHVNLTTELARNPQLREYIASHIESEIAERMANGESPAEISGSVWVPQSAYGSSAAGKDQQLALGGTYFEFHVVGSTAEGGLELRLNVSDHYFWSPSDRSRSTQCLHVAGSELVAAGRASEFYQLGEGQMTIADPSRTQPMDPIEGPPSGSD
ncbi:MAG TPA: hypothetical protein VER12_16885 [Polyangiaceae bacterium]|nr:hypothetical protein [Polyangiaceae bacterium]